MYLQLGEARFVRPESIFAEGLREQPTVDEGEGPMSNAIPAVVWLFRLNATWSRGLALDVEHAPLFIDALGYGANKYKIGQSQ